MSAPDATQPVGAGTVLCGRYRLVRVIAQGGMASVWEGHDNVLARSVAIKMLHPHLASDQLFLERFRREAISAARLAHPNVVATFDAGITAEGTAFIVMELVRGRTLSTFEADHRPLPIFVCIEIGIQIADALTHSHGAGLVHRDIKPANVLVCDIESDGVPLVKVTDFGIAKAAEGLGLELTKTGMVLGTPRYLSPEQIEGREPDARADLYALGVVLFELVAGIPPFRGPTEVAVAVQHLNDTPARLRDLRPNVPPALESLVAQLLAKRPEDRPPSAVAVRRALSAIDARGRPAGRPASTGAAVFDRGPAPVTGAPPGSIPPPPAAMPPMQAPLPPMQAPVNQPRPARPVAPRSAVPPPPPPPNPADLVSPWPTPPRAAPSRSAPVPTAVGGPARSRPAGVGPPPGSAGRSNPPGRPPSGPAPSHRAHGRPPPVRRPNWAGRFVALLVIVAIVVAVVVLARHGTTGPRRSSSSSGTTVPSAIKIQSVSVFHLERDADNSATVDYVIDGNPDTSWETDTYFGPNFAGLRHGLGLAFTLGSAEPLHHLKVTSATVGWSAQVYVADAVPDPPSLAPWGAPVASQTDIDGSTTFALDGRQGSAILLWITNLGPTNQASIAEASLS